MNKFAAEVVNYYDNYDYLATGMFKESDWQQKMASASGACAVGLPTGSMVRTSSNEYLYNSVYYDAKGRAVRTFGPHLGGGLQETTTSYTFTNNPRVVSTTEYNANGDVEGSAEYTYAYNQYNDKLQSIDPLFCRICNLAAALYREFVTPIVAKRQNIASKTDVSKRWEF